MADAEDLKSSGDFSSCGFDSHPGHHFSILALHGLLSSEIRIVVDFLPAQHVVARVVPTLVR